ncbi:MAG: response regulator [Spirochaetota bacterium]
MNDGIFEAAFANSPIGMAFTNTDGKVIRLNRPLEELLIRYEIEPTLTNICDLFVPNDRDASFARFALLSRNGGRSSWLARVANGSRHGVWQIDVSLVSGSDDQRILLIAIHDVTSQKRVEQRLKTAKVAAERATETKSAFLANMSHEIRTPIHTITGMTELLAGTLLDEEQREYADQVRFSAEVLLFLINDILDFSRIEAGKLSIDTISFSPTEVVHDSIDMVCVQAHRKGVEVVVHVEAGIPDEVSGDPGRLRQVIVNLANNAVKFTEKGQIVVRLKIVSQSDTEVTLRVEVEDTGVGISEEKQRRLFEPFSQADSSTTRRFGGSGLGLSISKSLVEMMRGSIGLTSRLGAGSCFWFELPVAVVAAKEHSPRPLEGCRAMLVDDNAESADAIRDYVHRAGAEIEVVTSGETCIEELRKAATSDMPFDLVLVDLELPGMDGWQLASRITDDALIADTPRVLLSPIGLLAGEAKMKRLHWFQGYAKKPVRESDLLDQIRLAINDVPELIPVDEGNEDLVSEPIFRSATIVVAEDHEVNQTLFRTILEKMGHRTILASDGYQAVEAVEHNEVDLLFMDVQMPEKNGYQATEELRSKGYAVPIIAVTANAIKGERERCIAVGMNDFLGKPFRKADLERLLDRWLTDLPGSGENSYGDEKFTIAEEHLGKPIYLDNAPIFDRESALERFMGKSDIVDKVIGQFVERHTASLSEIRRAAGDARYDDVRGAAHAIKGGAWNIDAVLLGNVAALLEAAAKLGDRTRVEHYVERLAVEMQQFEREAGSGAMAHESD